MMTLNRSCVVCGQRADTEGHRIKVLAHDKDNSLVWTVGEFSRAIHNLAVREVVEGEVLATRMAAVASFKGRRFVVRDVWSGPECEHIVLVPSSITQAPPEALEALVDGAKR